MITAVYTRWGWVSQRAFYRLKQAYEDAIEQGQGSFTLDGQPFLTSFVGHLVRFLESEGLVPIETTEPVTLFEPEQGHA
jgi:hypothetical protein